MEEFTLALISGVFVVLSILAVGLTRIYARNAKNDKPESTNPDELYGLIADAMNDGIKKAEDRRRKRLKRTQISEFTDEEIASIMAGRKAESDEEGEDDES